MPEFNQKTVGAKRLYAQYMIDVPRGKNRNRIVQRVPQLLHSASRSLSPLRESRARKIYRPDGTRPRALLISWPAGRPIRSLTRKIPKRSCSISLSSYRHPIRGNSRATGHHLSVKPPQDTACEAEGAVRGLYGLTA